MMLNSLGKHNASLFCGEKQPADVIDGRKRNGDVKSLVACREGNHFWGRRALKRYFEGSGACLKTSGQGVLPNRYRFVLSHDMRQGGWRPLFSLKLTAAQTSNLCIEAGCFDGGAETASG
ncbi:hypothetical protein [Candidimonas nitroreducens]|nr:hypothetical protein [Candidimonas nitroreducens]